MRGKPITRKVHSQRVLQAKRLIERGWYDGEIKIAIAEKEGCSRRTVERYIALARKMIQASTGRSVEELRRDAIAVYRGVVRKSTDDKNRLRAQERIDKLLGLEAPAVVHQEVRGLIRYEHIYKIIEAAKNDDEIRDLIIQLSRRMPNTQ